MPNPFQDVPMNLISLSVATLIRCNRGSAPEPSPPPLYVTLRHMLNADSAAPDCLAHMRSDTRATLSADKTMYPMLTAERIV